MAFHTAAQMDAAMAEAAAAARHGAKAGNTAHAASRMDHARLARDVLSKKAGSSGAGVPSPAEGQGQVDKAYRASGLQWGSGPRYRPDLADYGRTTGTGVQIGPQALRDEPSLRSTLIHENAHVEQLRDGRYARWNSDIGGTVNEAEAYRAELLNYQRTGISTADQQFLAGRYRQQFLTLEGQGARGDFYLRRILIYEDFSLLPRDTRIGPVPAWTR
jgi:hypothetical protein